MNKYKIKELEQEQHERHYIVEAENEEEAKDKVINGDVEKPTFEVMYNFEVSVDICEEVN